MQPEPILVYSNQDEYYKKNVKEIKVSKFIWYTSSFIGRAKIVGEHEKTDVFDLRKSKNHDKLYFIFSSQNANTLEPITEMSPKEIEKNEKLASRWSDT